jgi:iron(III) transport system permease protein
VKTEALSQPDIWAKIQVSWSRIRAYSAMIVVTVILLYLVMVPVVRLLINSFQLGHPAIPEGWTISHYITALSMPIFYKALGTTIWIAGIGTFFTVTIAVMFAWLIERTDMPFRNLAWTLILIPMAIPGVLFAMGWGLLLAPKTGAINIFLRDGLDFIGIHLTTGPINVYSLGGLIFIDGIRGVTTVFLMVVGSFRMMDPSLEEAARTLKAGGVATFF